MPVDCGRIMVVSVFFVILEQEESSTKFLSTLPVSLFQNNCHWGCSFWMMANIFYEFRRLFPICSVHMCRLSRNRDNFSRPNLFRVANPRFARCCRSPSSARIRGRAKDKNRNSSNTCNIEDFSHRCTQSSLNEYSLDDRQKGPRTRAPIVCMFRMDSCNK